MCGQGGQGTKGLSNERRKEREWKQTVEQNKTLGIRLDFELHNWKVDERTPQNKSGRKGRVQFYYLDQLTMWIMDMN